MNLPTVSISAASKLIEIAFQSDSVPILLGDGGLGKSYTFRKVAEDANLCLIDYRVAQKDPSSVTGYAIPNEHRTQINFLPVDTFPLADAGNGEPTPYPINPKTKKPYDGWLFLFDEITAAGKLMQAALYEPILDHAVGGKMLHPDCYVAAAGNALTSRAVSNPISAALGTRATWIYVESNVDGWINDFALPEGIDHRIIAFIQRNPHMINLFSEFEPMKTGECTYACERSWTSLDSKIKVGVLDDPEYKDTNLTALFAGDVGVRAATDFLAFIANYQDPSFPTKEQILNTPGSAPLPQQNEKLYTIACMISSMLADIDLNKNPSEFKSVMAYLDRVDSVQGEIATYALQSATKRNPKLATHPLTTALIMKSINAAANTIL